METLEKLITENNQLVYFVLLSIFLGIEIISNVPAVLHTPLMSGANAIHGVVLVGAILVMTHVSENDYFTMVVGTLAVFLGTLNVAGGFFITARMLSMFKSNKSNRKI